MPERPVETKDGVPTEHGERCDAGVHAAVSWTYGFPGREVEMLLRIRRALKEPRGWWTAQDETDYQRALAPVHREEGKGNA